MDSILAFVKPYYEGKDIMHDLSHISRVLIYVEKLLKVGDYEANVDILKYAAYFHGFIYNSEEKIVEWLKGEKISNAKIDRIITAAWELQKDWSAKTLEETIEYIENNILDKGICYLPEAQMIFYQQQEFAKSFIKDLKEGLV